MKIFNTTILIIASFLSTCFFQPVWAMDVEAQGPITTVPTESIYQMLEQCPMKTYLDIARLMKLRSICKLWSEILSNEFIIKNMNPVLKDTQTTLSQALMGRSLAATLREFCIFKLWPDLHHNDHLNVFYSCIVTLFDNFGHTRYPDKVLIDKIQKLFAKCNINANISIFKKNLDGKTLECEVKSLLERCLDAHYADKESKYAIFDLLLSHGLDLSDLDVLTLIAKSCDYSLLSSMLQTPYRERVNVSYLFTAISSRCRRVLRLDRYLILGNEISQLIDIYLSIMPYQRLFEAVALQCCAPMLKKLLDKTPLTNIECKDILTCMFHGYNRLSSNEQNSLRLGFDGGHTLLHCTLTQVDGQYRLKGVTALQHFLLCYQVLVQSGKCIIPQRDDSAYAWLFELINQAEQTIGHDIALTYLNNIQVSDGEQTIDRDALSQNT